MTDFPPNWTQWLPLARIIIAHPVYSGQRQYGASATDAKEQIEHDARSIAKILAKELPAGTKPVPEPAASG